MKDFVLRHLPLHFRDDTETTPARYVLFVFSERVSAQRHPQRFHRPRFGFAASVAPEYPSVALGASVEFVLFFVAHLARVVLVQSAVLFAAQTQNLFYAKKAFDN